jgi:hypothetical protein
MRISCGFFKVSCIFEDTYNAASEAYYWSIVSVSNFDVLKLIPDTRSVSGES